MTGRLAYSSRRDADAQSRSSHSSFCSPLKLHRKTPSSTSSTPSVELVAVRPRTYGHWLLLSRSCNRLITAMISGSLTALNPDTLSGSRPSGS